MIKAVIFDLDHCLLSPHELGADVLAPVFRAIDEANRGRLTPEVLQGAMDDFMRAPFDAVARKHGFPEDVSARASAAYAGLAVEGPLHGYADLPVLARLPVRRYLVTTGFVRLQQSKIDALGIEPMFSEVHIDAIDRPGRTGKKAMFAGILASGGYAKHEVLVVGDSADSEIAAGNALGLATVQILRQGVVRCADATYHIADLAELEGLLKDR